VGPSAAVGADGAAVPEAVAAAVREAGEASQ
jgi:hypothetical protein